MPSQEFFWIGSIRSVIKSEICCFSMVQVIRLYTKKMPPWPIYTCLLNYFPKNIMIFLTQQVKSKMFGERKEQRVTFKIMKKCWENGPEGSKLIWEGLVFLLQPVCGKKEIKGYIWQLKILKDFIVFVLAIKSKISVIIYHLMIPKF